AGNPDKYTDTDECIRSIILCCSIQRVTLYTFRQLPVTAVHEKQNHSSAECCQGCQHVGMYSRARQELLECLINNLKPDRHHNKSGEKSRDCFCPVVAVMMIRIRRFARNF